MSITPEERAHIRRACEIANTPIVATSNASMADITLERSLDPTDIIRLLDDLEATEADRNEWRKALTWCTPMGSEYTTPQACREYIERRRQEEHKLTLDRLRQVRRLREQLTATEARRDRWKRAAKKARRRGNVWFGVLQSALANARETDRRLAAAEAQLDDVAEYLYASEGPPICEPDCACLYDWARARMAEEDTRD